MFDCFTFNLVDIKRCGVNIVCRNLHGTVSTAKSLHILYGFNFRKRQEFTGFLHISSNQNGKEFKMDPRRDRIGQHPHDNDDGDGVAHSMMRGIDYMRDPKLNKVRNEFWNFMGLF